MTSTVPHSHLTTAIEAACHKKPPRAGAGIVITSRPRVGARPAAPTTPFTPSPCPDCPQRALSTKRHGLELIGLLLEFLRPAPEAGFAPTLSASCQPSPGPMRLRNLTGRHVM